MSFCNFGIRHVNRKTYFLLTPTNESKNSKLSKDRIVTEIGREIVCTIFKVSTTTSKQKPNS